MSEQRIFCSQLSWRKQIKEKKIKNSIFLHNTFLFRTCFCANANGWMRRHHLTLTFLLCIPFHVSFLCVTPHCIPIKLHVPLSSSWQYKHTFLYSPVLSFISRNIWVMRYKWEKNSIKNRTWRLNSFRLPFVTLWHTEEQKKNKILCTLLKLLCLISESQLDFIILMQIY